MLEAEPLVLIKAWKYLGEQLYILHFLNNITVIATSYIDKILKRVKSRREYFYDVVPFDVKVFYSTIINHKFCFIHKFILSFYTFLRQF